MPNVRVNGADIHYEERGTGTEAVVFAHGLLFDWSIFADQIAALEGRYRCIAFDFRGQGESEITRSGYDMDTLSDDAAALIEAVGAVPCHFVGLSMGGFVALRLAIRRSAILRSLTLLDTSADPELPLDRLRYRLLAFLGRWFGFRPFINRVMRIMFSENARSDPALMSRWHDRILANDRIGATRAVGGVIGRTGVYEGLKTIALPTLVIVGDRDHATVPAHSRRLHVAIRDSQLIVLPGVGHMSTLEAPAAVAETLRRFLDSVAAGETTASPFSTSAT